MQSAPAQHITVSEALAGATHRLRQAGIESATLDARLLLMHTLSFSREALIANQRNPVNHEFLYAYDELISRREAREPISHILGGREFWSLMFEVTPDTLDPRPDSETLVETVLELLPERERPLSMLDLGTGTGCLLISLLVEYPNALGVGVDISPEALEVATRNAERILGDDRAAFVLSDWTSNVEGRYDLIISNPPYIPLADLPGLAPEVRLFEPALALTDGADGLESYRALAPQIIALLNPGGKLVVEIGHGQESDVENIMRSCGLEMIAAKKDLSGIIRCISFKTP